MSTNPLDFKSKKDRNDFFISLVVILFFGWLFYYFGFQSSPNLDFVDNEIVAESTNIDFKDSDNDGIYDSNDKCPNEPGLEDTNGCPKDSDGDGVADFYDRCPATPGTSERKGCPDLENNDIDGDGFVGDADRCPDIAGADAGCPLDFDKDGIPNSEDECPKQRGNAKNNGCPPDQDRDGVADQIDKCPELRGVPENNGCPSDQDKDGVYDKDDLCPNAPGLKATAGCPDQDSDGVIDKDDKCPKERGSAANKGCPVKDKDGDGVPDAKDKCPNRAGPAASNGCPEVKLTEREKKVIEEAISNVVFLSGSPNLTSYSKGLVIKIADLMKKYPDAILKISGHTDNLGGAKSNLTLSQNRAATCLNLLAQQGINRNRMSSEGFGETSPVASNDTPEGRLKNRRVEFKLSY